MPTRLRYWFPAIGMAFLISLFSTQYFSSQQTARAIYPILRWLFPTAGPHMLHMMHTAIRKMAHLAEFAIFSITVFRGVRGDRSGWKLSWALITVSIAVGYAGLDEWHQSFVPFRAARLRDVLIDSTGAILAQAVVWVYAKVRHDPTGSSPNADTLIPE